MKVELVYATKTIQKRYTLELTEGTTVEDAIEQTRVLKDFPEIDLKTQPVGIFSEIIELGHRLKEGDRVEIYRTLTIDPKEARRIRAEEKRKKEGLKLFGA
ncbi:RnfH family protein [Fastidiosibacter lacustris]|uniref:RnfH family protein n=1 Tax=Fastidiosibacter lacustris TaxID=2056695 RepID=UPI000E34771C|nr:RnfH family protein [Fastidiosibacter lacustris]